MEASHTQPTVVVRVRPRHAPDVWREIELLERQTLHDLHSAIQDAFELDDEHLYAFYLNNRPFDKLFNYEGPGTKRETRRTEDTSLAALELKQNKRFLYLFDFGDELRHEVRVLRRGARQSEASYPRIVASHGKAPEQYPDWNELDAPDPGEEEDGEEHTHACAHGEVASRISAEVRQALEQLIPEVESCAAANRVRWTGQSTSDVEDDDADVGDDLEGDDDDYDVHFKPGPPPPPAELKRHYGLAKDLLQHAGGDLGVIHVVVEHSIDENVIGWLCHLPDDLSQAELHEPALDLAQALLASEPQLGLRRSMPRLLMRAGHPDQALAALDECLIQEPDDTELLLDAGDLQATLGNTDQAIVSYRAALNWAGSDLELREEILETLLPLLEKTGQRDEASRLVRSEQQLVERVAPWAVATPLRREQPKVGRNDPCPCGSGKKFKKCCGKPD